MERWHHLPYVMHIDTFAGQALLMTSQSRSRTEYLISTDNIIVLDWYVNLTKQSDLIGKLKYDLMRFLE